MPSKETSKPTASPTASPTSTATAKTGEIVTGDIDFSGKIDVTDLTTLSLYLLGDKDLSEDAPKAADTDGDGKVALTDLATLRQYISKKITKFR